MNRTYALLVILLLFTLPLLSQKDIKEGVELTFNQTNIIDIDKWEVDFGDTSYFVFKDQVTQLAADEFMFFVDSVKHKLFFDRWYNIKITAFNSNNEKSDNSAVFDQYFLFGDLNEDLTVDAHDANLFRVDQHTNYPRSDINYDGIVDIFDLNLIRQNFGKIIQRGGN